jgi:acyl-CoA synthetase (AMP-forming)/AMP-acid ligase II
VATASTIRSTAGTRPGGQVALLCRHGSGTVVALLAALAAGRAYVPLGPTFPAHRLAHILADSEAAVLTDAEHADRADRLRDLAGRPDLRVVPVEPAGGPADLADLVAGLAGPAGPDDPAYLLYTSGSTGTGEGGRAEPPQRAVRRGQPHQTISWSTLPIGFALLAPLGTALFEPMLAPGSPGRWAR